MKTLLLIFTIFLLAENVSSQEDPFYYNFEEKIFLQERNDKVMLQLSKQADTAALLSIIRTDDSVQIMPEQETGELSDLVIVESKNNADISAATLAKYKNDSNVVYASLMLEYRGFLQGLTNMFVAKLKPESSLEQLQNLVKENGCVLGKENEFVKKKFVITVPKTSVLNSLQLANVFYETGLFVYSAPTFVSFNVLQSSQEEIRLNAYPLPFGDKLTIEYAVDIAGEITIAICSLDGRELMLLKNKAQHERGAYNLEFNGNNLPEGAYLLKITTDNTSNSHKIIKMK